MGGIFLKIVLIFGNVDCSEFIKKLNDSTFIYRLRKSKIELDILIYYIADLCRITKSDIQNKKFEQLSPNFF